MLQQLRPSSTNEHQIDYADVLQFDWRSGVAQACRSEWQADGPQAELSDYPLSVSCEIWLNVRAINLHGLALFHEAQGLSDTPKSQDAPLVFTEAEAAKRLQISVSTLRRWRQKNCAPPHLRIGGILRYSAADLQAFVNAHLSNTEVA
jgi:predicted DNA-binding transcriptional regulator AlpA